jgi:dTDP-4-dehydrorhamnose reductase
MDRSYNAMALGLAVRVLILGGGGMLGHKLAQELRTEFEVWATLRGPSAAYSRYGVLDDGRILPGIDVSNLETVSDAMAHTRADAVINCIGIIKQLPASQDPVASLTINSLLPHQLQRLCRLHGARLLHFSTDCVFNGRKGMYTENEPSDALDLYGRTKFLGETAGAGALTIRSSIIGRELLTRSGLVEWFLSQRGGRVGGYTRAVYSGFTTRAMARIVRSVLVDYPQLEGLWQVSSDPIAKYDLLLLMRDAYGLDVDVIPDDRVCLDRSLDSSRFRALTAFVPPSWQTMIRDMAMDPTPYEEWRGRA